jgi:hypothetical protein
MTAEAILTTTVFRLFVIQSVFQFFSVVGVR